MNTDAYFAVDPLTPACAKALQTVWHQTQKRLPNAKLYALIDTAFDESTCADYLQHHSSGQAMSLYAGTEFEDLASVSPWLVALDSDDRGSVAKEIETLGALRGVRPMLSFVATQSGLADLQQHFQLFLKVVVDGDLPLVRRFADTRITDPLFSVFSPAQRAAFIPPGMGLWFPRRKSGTIGGVLPDSGRMVAPATETLQFDARQFADMLNAADADWVIQSLATTDPVRFAHSRPSDVHVFFQNQVARARAHGMLGAPGLEIYCVTAWVTGPEFDLQPDFAHAIRAACSAPGEFARLLAQVPAPAWRDAAQPASARGNA